MGHAAQAFATIVALSGLLGISTAHATYTQLNLQARRFSVNRVVAGVHFPIDAAAGQMLGMSLGEYFLCKCGLLNVCNGRTFAPTLAGSNVKNNFLGDGPDLPNGAGAPAALQPITTSPFLVELTALAQAEWA
jgi:hypothetical protein